MSEMLTPLTEDPSRPGAGRQRLILLALLLVLIGGLGIAVALSGDEAGAPDPSEETAEADVDRDADVEPVALDLAGAYDGLDSLGLPVATTPDIGLVDGQTVIIEGSGFPPDTQIGWSQCRFRIPIGGQDDCDLGNFDLGSTDGEGAFSVEFVVNRYVAAASGNFDCLESTLDDGCGIGVGVLSDYDQSGSARFFFDPASDGDAPPRIEVSETTGLVDGQELIVTGTGFLPGEVAYLTQCPVGGANGIGSCYGENQVGQIEIDQQGNFAVTVPALRVVEGNQGPIDCFTSPYECLVIVQASRLANTVPLTFDGGVVVPRDIEFTIEPNENLVDGQSVALAFFDLPVEGTLTIEQCVDQGPEGESCGLAQAAVVANGDATSQLAVSQFLTNAAGELVDCAGPARTCYVKVWSAELEPIRIPVHFAEG